MSLLEFTLDDGRRVGIPRGTAILICNLETTPDPAHREAKTLIRYTLGLNQARHAWVRDAHRHVMNLFPRAVGGLGWTRAVDAADNEIAFPEGAINAFEEQPRRPEDPEDAAPLYRVILNVETGPIEIDLRGTYDDLKAMLGEKPDEKQKTAPSRARRQSGNGAGGARKK